MSAGPHTLKKETKNTETKILWIQFGNLGKFKALIFWNVIGNNVFYWLDDKSTGIYNKNSKTAATRQEFVT